MFSDALDFCHSLGYSLFMGDPNKRIQELEEQIAELKARWPAHSAQPWMLQQLEELEEKLEAIKQEQKNAHESSS
jgi:chromosome segregation ATPase